MAERVDQSALHECHVYFMHHVTLK